ncbi:MAG: hypothetical protein GY810_01770 [Aureispira sp.]|nr:hypothetical protein [Aureispira sp.]
METNALPKSQLLNILCLVLIAGLTLNSISPITSIPLSRQLADYAVELMFIFLLGGALMFLLKQNFIMAVSFIGCIALNIFLKDAQNQTFSYTTATQDLELTVAYLALEEVDEDKLEKLANLNTNFLSIEVPTSAEYRAKLIQYLAQSHPYQQAIQQDEGKEVLIFSSYRLEDLDTIYCNGVPSLAGAIYIDSLHEQIRFLGTYIPQTPLDAQDSYETAEEHLTHLSSYLKTTATTQPLITVSEIHLKSWAPELKAFKDSNTLHDSRMDLEFSNLEKHIFYSEELVCTSFESISFGEGVVGTYQFRKSTSSTKESTPSQLTQVMM